MPRQNLLRQILGRNLPKLTATDWIGFSNLSDDSRVEGRRTDFVSGKPASSHAEAHALHERLYTHIRGGLMEHQEAYANSRALPPEKASALKDVIAHGIYLRKLTYANDLALPAKAGDLRKVFAKACKYVASKQVAATMTRVGFQDNELARRRMFFEEALSRLEQKKDAELIHMDDEQREALEKADEVNRYKLITILGERSANFVLNKQFELELLFLGQFGLNPRGLLI